MLLFYIDESGTGWKDDRSSFFLLSAIAIKATDWNVVDDAVSAFKRQLFSWAKPEDFEIKGRDIRRGDNFFKTLNWPERVSVINKIAHMIAELPCRVYAVRVNKAYLPEYVASDEQLYRLAFWRLLDELDTELKEMSIDERGLLLVDTRSDLHSSIQDRRLIDA